MSQLSDLLKFQMKSAGIPKPFEELEFHNERKWRFDFAWPQFMVAVEVEGGIWSGGAHTRGAHFISDCQKYNEAAIIGWWVLRFPTNMIKDGSALIQIERALI